MSIQAVGWVLEQDIKPGPKLVLVSIANHADRQGSNAFPEQASIAIEANVDERTVRRHVKWLDRHGLIVRYRRGRRGGTGRSSDGYEIPGMRGETVEACRARLRAAGKRLVTLDEHGTEVEDDGPEPPVDGPADPEPEPDNLTGSGRGAGDTSTGQPRHLNRTTTTPQPDTGVRGTVPNRPEPREEEGARDCTVVTWWAVAGALSRRDHDRLDADVGADALRAVLADLEAAGWTPSDLAGALTANPLHDHRGQPVASVARVLAARGRQLLAAGTPPAPSSPGPDPDCATCRGSGWATDRHDQGGDRPDGPGAYPCPCRTAA